MSDFSNQLDQWAVNDSKRGFSQLYLSEHALLREAADHIRKLEEALLPFAMIAEKDIGDDEADNDFYAVMSHKNARGPIPRVYHFRRALAALSKEGGK